MLPHFLHPGYKWNLIYKTIRLFRVIYFNSGLFNQFSPQSFSMDVSSRRKLPGVAQLLILFSLDQQQG